MANELDILMDKDPLDLSKRDLDDIISYHRSLRATADAKSKAKPTGPGPKINILELMGKGPVGEKKPGGGIRRL